MTTRLPFRQLPDVEELFDFSDPTTAAEFLRDEPESAFFSFQDQSPFGTAPSQRRAFDRSFQDINARFLGEQGRRARSGESSQAFLPFLEQEFDVKKDGISRAEMRFLGQPPAQRGDFSQFLNPRTRFLVNF